MTSTWTPTPLDEISNIRANLRATFATGRSRDIEYRKKQLLQLAYLIQDNKDRLAEALRTDLHRHPIETELIEQFPTTEAALGAYRNVAKWAAAESAPFAMNSFLLKPTIYREAKGTVLIVGPFNYPIYCNFMPLVGAIAAGCAVVLKPSEGSPASAALLTELIPKYLDPEMYAVVNGAIPEMQKLLSLQWDHIFFTGSTTVGRIVARAAAGHLTPVTLELGGKNPAIVDVDVDVDRAARTLLWAKNVNGGQTCTAPDYLLVHRDVHESLVAALKKTYAQFYPDAVQQQKQQTHLISSTAYRRVADLLKRSEGAVVLGAGLEGAEERSNYIPVTLVEAQLDDVLLEQEIFGPVWPMVVVDSIEEAVKYTQTRESPLAIYAYTNNSKTVNYIRENTRSGALIYNDSVVQGAVVGLPFGGVGASGQGAQSGKFTFDLFTYPRAVASAPSIFEKILSVRYPPYTDGTLRFIRTFITPTVPYRRPGTEASLLRTAITPVALVLSLVAAYAYRVNGGLRAMWSTLLSGLRG